MLPAKAVVLLVLCLFLGHARSNLTPDAYRNLEEALREVIEEQEAEENAELTDDDDIDIMSRMSQTKNYEAAKEAIAEAKKQLEEEFVRRNEFFKTNIDTAPGGGSAASMAGLNDLKYESSSEGEHEENKTLIALFATEILFKSGDFKTLKKLLKNNGVKKAFSEEEGSCVNNEPIKLDCDTQATSAFRTITGVCNNLDNPRWGSAFTPQPRVLDAEYGDEIQSPRTTGVNNKPLPSARTVSVEVHSGEGDNLSTPDDTDRTVMVMAWGQFLDHDCSETPMTKGRLDTNVGCCVLSKEVRETRETQCFTIDIEPGDRQFNTTCMDLVRSLPTRENPCVPGIREQINSISSFIDGSQIYGSEDHLADDLRTKTKGALKLVNVGGTQVLPKNKDTACMKERTDAHCLLAGDVRVNENPFLASLHTGFVLYHNKLAEQFATKSNLTDEEIYQTTRKIIGAILQHVTYSAWLPEVIGADAVKKNKLNEKKNDRYKTKTNPSIQNEFSTAALRHGHSMVISEMKRLNVDFGEVGSPIPLDSAFFKPDLLFEQTQVSQLVRWLANAPCKKTDAQMVSELQETLFATPEHLGLDLAALNIQRGREHGLPGYKKYRKECGLSVPKDFQDLDDHSKEFRDKLEKVYDNVEDIDLFAGALSEDNIDDANIGPTFACLLARQFRALKEGDRYWYERDEPEGFKPDQLVNIKQVLLSKIFCDIYQLPEIQENMFRIPKTSELVACSALDGINVDLWIS